MNLQTKFIISFLLVSLMVALLRSLAHKKLTAGQVIFWMILLLGAEILTIFPGVIDFLSFIWGDLLPVSWISFIGLLSLIFYLLYQTIRFNELKEKTIQLAKSITFLEHELRQNSINDK